MTEGGELCGRRSDGARSRCFEIPIYRTGLSYSYVFDFGAIFYTCGYLFIH
jgi:hypothetical protein